MQMPFTKKTALQEMDADIARLQRQRGILDKKVATTRSEYEAAVAARLDVYTKTDLSDPKAEQKAQSRVDTARSAVEGFTVALEKIDRDLADAQQRADQERQNIERIAASDEIERQVFAFEKTIEPMLMALRAFSKAAGELEHVNFEISAIAKYAHGAGSELEIASSLGLVDLRNIAASVREGRTRIPGKPLPPPAPQPAPVVQRIWTLKPIAWTENGQIKKIDMNEQCDVSPALAAKAISAAAAVLVGDPRFGKSAVSSRRWNGFAPSLQDCVLLDDGAESAAVEAKARPDEVKILHSSIDPNFEVVDLGPAYTLKTHGPEAA
jgi:hypothetical protein